MPTEKAFLEIEGQGEKLPCLFNPSELALNRANGWAADSMPGKGVPTLRYTGAQSGQMAVRLFFDTTADGQPVTKYTGKIMKLMDVDPSLPAATRKVSTCVRRGCAFHWATCIRSRPSSRRLDLAFVYFSGTGMPLRARLDLLLTQYDKEIGLRAAEPDVGYPPPASGPPHPTG